MLTIVAFALLAMSRGESLDTETAFPTVAILTMITHPANMIMTIVPRAIVANANSERIQDYLASQEQDDRVASAEGVDDAFPAISLKNLSVLDESGDKKTLEGVSIDVPRGSVAVISGPVGAGKTILARVVLGEVAPSEGTVTLSTKYIAYCSQVPWLPSRPIKDIICGPIKEGNRDEAWYKTVIQACCLNEDFDTLPGGDSTAVGAKGMNLSGGQRQRVVSWAVKPARQWC